MTEYAHFLSCEVKFKSCGALLCPWKLRSSSPCSRTALKNRHVFQTRATELPTEENKISSKNITNLYFRKKKKFAKQRKKLNFTVWEICFWTTLPSTGFPPPRDVWPTLHSARGFSEEGTACPNEKFNIHLFGSRNHF